MYDGFYFDSFYDLPPKALPKDCEYYFNVLYLAVSVPPGTFGSTWEFTDISRIKDPRPICVYYYEDPDVDDWEIEANPHAVVEINTKTREVVWYDMIDFETEKPWLIEPIGEDFDYEESDEEEE